MKELTSYNRGAGYLNKIFDLLNREFFESTLSRPTITIQSTPKAYGHFSLNSDTWISKLGGTHEINIGAGTLARPIENVVATLLHEMVHYFNHINGVQDCSRGNTYHNGKFRRAAEERGLKAIIAAAGGAAHLGGVLAAATVLPVIGIPVAGGALLGKFGVILANVLMYIAAVLTIVSGAEYIIRNFSCIKDM